MAVVSNVMFRELSFQATPLDQLTCLQAITSVHNVTRITAAVVSSNSINTQLTAVRGTQQTFINICQR